MLRGIERIFCAVRLFQKYVSLYCIECNIKLYFIIKREVEGKTKVDMITFHGCEKDLAGALNSHVEV